MHIASLWLMASAPWLGTSWSLRYFNLLPYLFDSSSSFYGMYSLGSIQMILMPVGATYNIDIGDLLVTSSKDGT